MKFVAILSLLLGTNAIGDGEHDASRDLRGGRGGWGGGGGRGHHGGGHHGGGHGGRRNHTEWLNQTCATNNITCTEVDPEVLANCTYRHHHHGGDDTSEDTDRKLLFVDEAPDVEDEELLELYDLFEGVDELEEAWNGIPPTELRGSVVDGRDLHGGGRHGGGRHHGNRWGNLTDAELEEMKLKRLTCKCCGNHTD